MRKRLEIEHKSSIRAGLLATQGIRGGANQETLKRIIDTGFIFWAISDKNWTLNGATVHVSLIAFTGTNEFDTVCLDGASVPVIFADLSSQIDTTEANRLEENIGICFRGTEMHGAFDLSSDVARKMLQAPVNVHGRYNLDVVKRYINAIDITTRDQNRYVIDFGTSLSLDNAAFYELPFEYIKKHVYPLRSRNRRESRKSRWWLHGEPNPGMRAAIQGLNRFIATPRVAKHRLFAWIDADKLPDSAICIFARSDDYFMGVLHSLFHELWARKVGTQLREAESGFRYTPKTTFDTFPFPYPPGTEPSEADSPIVRAIADAARELVRLRDAWLNPPNASEADLKDRTLTKLYNTRPDWLANAHRALDTAVFAAYDWPPTLTDQEILTNLLALNHERARTSVSTPQSEQKAK